MTRIQRIVTKQGHPVPKTAHSPKGPFPPELQGYDVDPRRPSGHGILGESTTFNHNPHNSAQPKIVSDYVPVDEILSPGLGATAQNNFTEPKVFKCNLCTALVFEHQIPDHRCEGIDG